MWRRSPWTFSRGRRRLIGALRVVIMVSLVLAISGVEVLLLVRAQSVAYVIDHSQSVRSTSSEVQNWVRESLKTRRPDDEASVIVFGKKPAVDTPPGSTAGWSGVQSVVEPDRTDLESALRLAAAILPAGKRRRVVLVSDGNQNTGDALSAARALAAAGVRVDVMPVIPQKGQDVLVDQLDAPGSVSEGSEMNLGIQLKSNYAGSGTLRVYQGPSIIHSATVQWEAGETTYVIRLKAGRPGLQPFRVTVEADDDTIASNNEASALVNVTGRARALIVAGNSSAHQNIVAALSAAGIDTVVTAPHDVPRTVDGWSQYSLVVLAEAPAQDWPDQSMEALEIAVRDLGRGLVMVGGDESYGPGGYFRTPIEKALPVYMDIRGKGEIPTLALLLVIDKSGSMSEASAGVSKMDIAKEAAIRATEVLSPRDAVGVVAFDGEAKWVVNAQNPADLAAIQDDIASIRAGGGTNIYPGLELAYGALKAQNTKYKHIILLTDGMSATGGDYDALIKKMREDGITLSSVAVGNDADRALLERLAKQGEGRYYFSSDTATIPKIFTKETILASRNYFVDAQFSPVLRWRSPLVKDITAVPDLYGYVATTPKEIAQVVLESHKEEPVLVQWQYGLGRAVAWTSDARGRWTGDWIHSGDFARLWRNIAAYLVQPAGIPGYELTTSAKAEKAVLQLETPVDSGVRRATARVVTPDSQVLELPLEQVAPGQYTGTFDAAKPGSYLAQVALYNEEGSIGSLSGGVSVQYSPEFKVTGANTGLLAEIARLGGGVVIDEPADAWEQNLKPVFSTVPLWPFLLMLACILLPLEVATRKIQIGAEEVRKVLSHARFAPVRHGEIAQDPTVSRLMGRKAVSQKGIGAGVTPTMPPGGLPKVEVPPPGKSKLEAAALPKSEPKAIDASRLLSRKKDRGDSS